MLLEFTVGNFLSFKEQVTLSLEASSVSEYPENTFSVGKHTLLKSAVVYGANASGKSNLMRAFMDMRRLVRDSAKMSSTDTFNVQPFLLNTLTVEAPCFFEILFWVDGMRYRYGFEVSAERVHTEWLYQAKANVEKPLFIRDGDAIEVLTGKFPEGKGLEPKTRPNALFLAVCDQFNGEISQKIMQWFTHCNTLSGIDHENYRAVTFRLLNDPTCRLGMLTFLKQLDLGFGEVQVQEEEFSPEKLPENMPLAVRLRLTSELKGLKLYRFKAMHDMFDASGALVGKAAFDLDEQESAGTNKIFDLLGPIFDTLMRGMVLVVDELDAKLHPLLTKALVGLFNSVETNPHNAQLVFATHDTNLLTYGNFRRDQIYFVEKNKEGATALYSLVEYKEDGGTVRKDRSFEKDYIQGRYGAIPYLGDFSKIATPWLENKKSLTT